MKTFRHGMFYGDVESRRRVDDIELAALRPVVPEHEIETHTHDDAHFVLVMAGRYLSSARDMPAISAGPVLVYNPPGTTHRDCFRGLEGHFFTLSLPAARIAGRALPTHALRAGAIAEHHVRALRDELRRWDDVSPLQVEAGLERLLDSLRRHRRPEPGDGPAWLARAQARLRDECARPPRIEELAHLSGVHPVVFARTFRRRFGCSPGDYLRECRLDRAVRLLRDRRLPLSQVAARAGFSDQSHFSRAFRETFGCTPSAYRRAS